MSKTVTPWYLTREALALLSDCAKDAPVDVRFSHRFSLTRVEWREYDEEDDRVVALGTIRDRILTPLLNDAAACKDGRVDRAGLMVPVGMAIDAVAESPVCGDTTYYFADVAKVAAEIDLARRVAA